MSAARDMVDGFNRGMFAHYGLSAVSSEYSEVARNVKPPDDPRYELTDAGVDSLPDVNQKDEE